MFRIWAVRIFGIALIIVIVLTGFGNAVLFLWNNVIPEVFRLPVITYWQAVGLFCLSWIFFGSWRAFPRFPASLPDHFRGSLRPATKDAVRAALNTQESP